MALRCPACNAVLDNRVSPYGRCVDCRLVLNIPALVCEGPCVDELLDRVPDPPGLMSVDTISTELAVSVLLEMNFLRDIQTAARFFVELFPTTAKVWDAAAVRLHQEGERDAAYRILRKGIQQCDDPSRIRVELAAMLGMDGKPEQGLSILAEAESSTERYHVIKGNLLRALERWEEAAACWRQAIATDPTDDIAWNNLGFYLSRVCKRHEEAEQHFRRACEAFPTTKHFRARLGDALYFQRKYQEALEHYRMALSMIENCRYCDTHLDHDLQRMIRACEQALEGLTDR
ncbi:MAG: tetratricopeptide repeat protein [Rectinemataceae bacterium]|nr:tetratricopeptide repeat protein [Spirochaetaceae bacterium]